MSIENKNEINDIQEGERKQIEKIMREIDGIKYWEYTYITKLKGGKINKQIVKRKYKPKNQETKIKPKSKSKKEDLNINQEQQEEQQDNINDFIKEYKNQMLISLQNILKNQFNKSLTIEELNKI